MVVNELVVTVINSVLLSQTAFINTNTDSAYSVGGPTVMEGVQTVTFKAELLEPMHTLWTMVN